MNRHFNPLWSSLVPISKEEQGSILILDTLNAIPLEQSAVALDCAAEPVYVMHHQFRFFLEQLIHEQSTTIEGWIEMNGPLINDGFKEAKRT